VHTIGVRLQKCVHTLSGGVLWFCWSFARHVVQRHFPNKPYSERRRPEISPHSPTTPMFDICRGQMNSSRYLFL
jgi:hypothetical protein